MGIPLGSNFDLGAGIPLDSRLIVADTTERDAIPAVQRYVGMEVYSEADNQKYQLQGGILNANWEAVGGALPTDYVDLTTNQTVAGEKTWSNVAVFNDKVGIGGTPVSPSSWDGLTLHVDDDVGLPTVRLTHLTHEVFIGLSPGSTQFRANVPFLFVTTGDNDLSFWTNTLRRVTVLGDTGYVGIGTDAPLALLHLNGGVGLFDTGLVFGDGDSGIYESVDDTLRFRIGGSDRWQMITNFFKGSGVNGSATLYAGSPTLLNPTYIREGDFNTGIGGPYVAKQLGFIADGNEIFRMEGDGTNRRLRLNPDGAVGASTGIWFGDGDTGIYEGIDDVLYFRHVAGDRFRFSANYFDGFNNAGFRLIREVPTSTLPNIVPYGNDLNTGIGWAAADALSLIAGGVEIGRVETTGATLNNRTTLDELLMSAGVTPATEPGGLVWWNDGEYTLNIATGLGPVLQIGQETYLLIYNPSAVDTITNFTVLRPLAATVVSGLVIPTVEKTDSSIWEGVEGTIMIATMDIPPESVGLAVRFGRARGGDGSGTPYGEVWSPGEQLYVSETPGELTNVRPDFPSYNISLGGVINTGTAPDGELFISFTRNFNDTFDNFHNGTIRESFSFNVTEAAGTVTGHLDDQEGNNWLTYLFTDGFYLVDTTATIDIVLTPGTDIAPITNYIYVLETTKALTLSTVGFPVAEHIKIAQIVLQSATTTGTDGPLRNQNFNDHLQDTEGQGHLAHIGAKLRRFDSQWDSGTEGVVTVDAVPTPDDVWLTVTSGSIFQLHSQSFDAFDLEVAGHVHIVNNLATPYVTTSNLNTQILDSQGNTLNNRSFSFVVWGVVNSAGEPSQLMMNLPTNSYSFTVPDTAVQDPSNYAVYTIPSAFQGVGFLIARFTFTYKNDVWVLYNTEDLRGKLPNTSAGGGAGGTGVTTFLALTDTPASYIGEALRILQVNAGETALEFVDSPVATFGIEDQIPVTNALGTDFDYSADFKFSGTVLTVANSYINMTDIDIRDDGQRSLYINVANSNTFFGYQAGLNATGTLRGIFIGQGAGKGDGITAPLGFDNIMIGQNAGLKRTYGIQNVGIGNYVFEDLREGGYNIAIGGNALSNLVDGDFNVAIGYYAGSNIIGNRNVTIGYEGGRGAIGGVGISNVFIGYQAGLNFGTCYSNIGIGDSALYSLTTGGSNTVIGYWAGFSLSTTENNVFVGDFVGRYNTGTGNIFIGHNAGLGVTSISTGSYNTTLGFEAGKAITSGGNNIMIGRSVDVAAGSDTNTFRLGISTAYILEGSMSSGVEWVGSSYEARFDNITEFTGAGGITISSVITMPNLAQGVDSIVVSTASTGTLKTTTTLIWDGVTFGVGGNVQGFHFYMDSFDINSGPIIDTVETVLTNDDTHIPTSGAVFDAIAGISGVTIGSTGQIPYSNTGTPGTDFNYSAAFYYTTTELFLDGSIRIGSATSSKYILGETAISDKWIIGSAADTIGGSDDNLVLYSYSGSVGLYHAGNNQKLVTKTTGVDITGEIDVSGNGIFGNQSTFVHAGGSYRIQIASSTSNGYGALYLGGNRIDGNSCGQISFTNLAAISGDGRIAGIYGNNDITDVDAGELQFYCADQFGNFGRKMIIKSTGFVGIGTNLPAEKLVVYDATDEVGILCKRNIGTNDTETGHIRFESDAAGRYSEITGHRGASSQKHELRFYYYNAASILGMTLDSGGRVGIGTSTPSYAIEMYSSSPTVSFLNTASSDKAWRIASSGNNLTIIESGVTVTVTFEAGGNVGIGQTNPNYTLDVTGTFRITGDSEFESDVNIRGFDSLKLYSGVVDYVWMEFYADPAAQTTLSGYIGYSNSGGLDTMIINNGLSGGVIHISPGSSAAVWIGYGVDTKIQTVSDGASIKDNLYIGAGVNEDVILAFQQDYITPTTAGLFGWDDSVNAMVLQFGPTLGAIGRAELSATLLRFYGATTAGVWVHAESGAATLYLDGHTGNDAYINFRENGITEFIVGHDASSSLFQIHSGTTFTTAAAGDFSIDISGHIFMGSLQSINNTPTLRYNITSGEVTYYSSDARLKKNIRDFDVDALDVLSKFVPRTFEWKEFSGTSHGWIAQEGVDHILNMFPLVEKTGMYAISETEILPYYHKAIMQLEARIKELESQLK